MLNYGTTCALLLCAAAAVRAVPVALPADAPLDPRAAAAPVAVEFRPWADPGAVEGSCRGSGASSARAAKQICNLIKDT